MAIEAEPLARDVVRDPSAGLGALLDRFVGDLGARYAAPGGEPIGASEGLTAALTARWMLPMGHAGLEVHAAQDLASLARTWGTYDGYGEAQFDFSAPLVVPVDPVAHPLGLSAGSVGHTRGPRRALVAPHQAGANRRIEPREQWRATQDGRLSPYPAALGQAGAVTPSLLRFPDARATMARNAVSTGASGDRRPGTSSSGVPGAGAARAARPGQVATVLVADGLGRAWGGHTGAAAAATAAEAMADGVQARHLDGSARTPALWLVPAGTGAADRARLAGSVAVRRGASAGLASAVALTDRLAERGAPAEAGPGWLYPSDVGDLVRPSTPARDLGALAAPEASGARPAVRPSRAAVVEAASARPGPAASVARPVRSAAEAFLPANLRILGESAGAGPQATSAPWQAPSVSGAVWRALGRRAAEPGPARSEGFRRPALGETPAAFFEAGAPGVLVQQPPRVGEAAAAASAADRGRAAPPRRTPAGPASADREPGLAAFSGAALRGANPLARAVGRGVGAEADPVGAGAPVAHQVAARALAHAAGGVGALLSALPAARDFGAVDADRSGAVVSALLSRLAEARILGPRLATDSTDADLRPVWSQTGGGALDATWVRPAAPVASLAGDAAAAPERSRGRTATVSSTASLVPTAAGQGSPARATAALARGAVREGAAAVALGALSGSNALVVAGRQASLMRAGRAMTALRPTALDAPGRAESSLGAAPVAQVGAARRAGLAAAPLATEAFAERFAAERFEVGSPLLAAEAPAPAAGVAFWSTPGTLVVPLNWSLAAADGQQAALASVGRRGPSVAPGAQPAASAGRMAPSLAAASVLPNRTLAAADARLDAADRVRGLPVAAGAAPALTPRRAGRAVQAAARFADARLAAVPSATAAARSQGGREVPGVLVAAEKGPTAGRPSDAAVRSERAPTAREALGRPSGVATDAAATPRAGAPRLDALPRLATGLLAAFERADRGLIAERAGPDSVPALGAQVRADGIARSAAAEAAGLAGLGVGGRTTRHDGSPGALVAPPPARREGASGTADADRASRPGAIRGAASSGTSRASRPVDMGRPGLMAAAATALTARLQAARSRVFEAAARALTRVVVPSVPTSGRTASPLVSRSGAARSPAWAGESSGALVAGAPSRARLDRPAALEGLRAPTQARAPSVGGTLSGDASLVARLLGAQTESGGAVEFGAWSERPGALVAPATAERSVGADAGTSPSGAASGSAGSARSAQGARPGRRLGFAPGNLDRALVAFGRAARSEAERGGGGRVGRAAVAAQLGGDGGFTDLAGALVQTGAEATRAGGSGIARADAPRVRSSMRLPGSLFADRGPSITLGAHDAGPARVMVATGARAAEQALRSTPGERPERGTETNEEARHRNAEQSEDTLSPEEIERIARDVIARLEKEAEADRDLFGEDFD